ncbi:unnamed protein product [Caenorhabditis auriculariae]|uniref:Protein CLP1 homolog n=1 Tax=Caenorhabditis auriculariae TaxID=2777116 RepID=A0A8S1GRQ5_9PELO|nr:unnamed protein product [Caenorhabditis auriculariae]
MAEETQVKEFELTEDSELRFEVGDEDVVLELVKGCAEVFGTDLQENKKYAFPPYTRVAVYTWKEAVVELVGPAESAYVAKHTPMVIYLNTHAAMEQVRQHRETKDSLSKGPRLMLVGPTDVGKSTVGRILCNYAVRQGRTPVYVDLDVGQGSISIPGTIGATLIQKTADVVEGFEREHPLVYNFGYATPSANISLYETLVKELADTVTRQVSENDEARIGGMIINTCGWVTGEGYSCLSMAASAFEVDVIVVLDHERLYNDLSRDLPPFVKLLHQPKSGGVETRSKESRVLARAASIHRYFYGTRSHHLFPFTFDIQVSDVILCKIGTEKIPESCLPFGVEPENHETKVVDMSLAPDLVHHLFALSPCTEIGPAVTKASVMGFILVTAVNMETSSMTVLCPQNVLPTKVLVYMDLTHVDDQVQR